MQSLDPSNQRLAPTQISHIDTPKRVHFSPTIPPLECREYGISNQLIEIRITMYMVDIEGLSKVDVEIQSR
jgi:hypothetical protein